MGCHLLTARVHLELATQCVSFGVGGYARCRNRPQVSDEWWPMVTLSGVLFTASERAFNGRPHQQSITLRIVYVASTARQCRLRLTWAGITETIAPDVLTTVVDFQSTVD